MRLETSGEPRLRCRIRLRTENHLNGRGSQLVNVLAQFEEVHRKLREHAESMPQDHELNSIVLSHTKVVDELRTAVARSRIERFDRIAPSLRALVADCSRRFGVLVDLDIADGHMVLDRSVLASMEEIIKRLVRLCLRDGIEQPEHRIAAGKPARALLRLRLEADGSDVVCRIEHDGMPFNSHDVGQHAAKHGLLTRPLEAYTEEELGALLLVPGFAAASKISCCRHVFPNSTKLHRFCSTWAVAARCAIPIAARLRSCCTFPCRSPLWKQRFCARVQ